MSFIVLLAAFKSSILSIDSKLRSSTSFKSPSPLIHFVKYCEALPSKAASSPFSRFLSLTKNSTTEIKSFPTVPKKVKKKSN